VLAGFLGLFAERTYLFAISGPLAALVFLAAIWLPALPRSEE